MRVLILLSLVGLFQLSFLQADENLNRRTSIDWESFVYGGITNYSAGEHSTLFIEYTTKGLSSNGIQNTGGFSVWGMGWNSEGMFGNGTTVDQKRPTHLFDADIRKVSAGYFHSLFLYADGSLWGSGFNSAGQLGDGTQVNKTSPIKVVSGEVVDAVAGTRHSGFIKSDGSLWLMGDNQYGQLGIGNYSDQSTPVKVIEKDVLFVDAGGFNTLFVKSDGSLWGMGENEDGQLGVVGPEAINTPIEIVSEGVIAASFGWNCLAFIKNDNSLWALGNNKWGQLGNGTNEPSSTPVMIEASGVTSVSAGGGHLLYIKEDGSLWGVGRSDGRLGIGNEVDQKTPVEIFKPGLEFKFTPFGSVLEYTSVISVSAGGTHSLFMKSDGSLWGVGSNWIWGFGHGESVSDVYEPVKIWSSATTSYYYEVTVEPSVGGSVEGGGSIPLNEEAKVTAVPAPGYKFDSWSGDLKSLQNPFTFRRYHDLKLRANFIEDFSVDNGGGENNPDESTDFDKNSSDTDIDLEGEFISGGILNYSAGEHSTMLIEFDQNSYDHGAGDLDEFSVWGMGWNSHGMFGDGSTLDKKALSFLFKSDVRKVSAGYFHSLFLYADGSLWATGFNSFGQLGDGTKVNKTSPIKVVSDEVVDAVAGTTHSGFIKSDGSLWLMGDNQYGQLGIGNYSDQPTPVKVIEKDVLFVDIGGFNTLFVKSDGSLWVMGNNEYGQLGLIDSEFINTPIRIIEKDVIAASFGSNFLTFIKSDGSLWGMGDNQWGQLGNASTKSSNTPVMIESSGVTSVSAGGGHLLYIKEDGSLWGVGRNDQGRLGIGNEVDQKISVEIFQPGLELNSGTFGGQTEHTYVISVSAGGSHSLFMKSDGSLWGMGSNWIGGLGQGESVSDVYEPVEILPSATTSYYYEVTVEPSIGGSVEGGGSIPLNKEAKVTAVPAPGYKFDSWSGDLQSLQNPFTFRRFHDLKLRANFVEDISDDNGDGENKPDESSGFDTNTEDEDGKSDQSYEQKNLVTPFVNGWFYEPKMGWLFTNKVAFPYIYDSNNSSWMYFKSGSDFPQFWHYGKEEWVELR